MSVLVLLLLLISVNYGWSEFGLAGPNHMQQSQATSTGVYVCLSPQCCKNLMCIIWCTEVKSTMCTVYCCLSEGDNYVCKNMSRETKTADSSNLSVCVSNNVCALPPYSNIFFSSFKITQKHNRPTYLVWFAVKPRHDRKCSVLKA